MEKSLFKEFPEVSTKEWKQKIQFDLKGLDYNDTLIWQSPEGIDVKPFYNQDDLVDKSITEQGSNNSWKILQTIYVADLIKSNKNARDVTERGANAIRYILPDSDINIAELIKGIDLNKITIFFKCEFLSNSIIDKVESLKTKLNTPSDNFYFEIDIIGNLARSGNWFNNLSQDFLEYESIMNKTERISVDLSLYQNAGANMVQQLAYGLAHVNEYLNHIDNRNLNYAELKIQFSVAVGSNYFFEIAKLKALRLVWRSLATLFGIAGECEIIASPSKRNKTIYDYNTNMLRTTTECMSAIIGGADYVENFAYDGLYHKDNEFGNRISRNQLLVLKHESYFGSVSNAAQGSFYIESLTHQLAEKALDLFKQIELGGGFLSQLKENKIQTKIKVSAAKEQSEFNNENIKLVGTNYHLNKEDRMKDDLELYPFAKYKPRKTLIEPVIEKRLAEELEKKRLNLEGWQGNQK